MHCEQQYCITNTFTFRFSLSICTKIKEDTAVDATQKINENDIRRYHHIVLSLYVYNQLMWYALDDCLVYGSIA